MKRPDMRAYFRSRIDLHVNGMMARNIAGVPAGVEKVSGRITDPEITVTMTDGKAWKWAGGKYASRKVNGCYAPLMPRPI